MSGTLDHTLTSLAGVWMDQFSEVPSADLSRSVNPGAFFWLLTAPFPPRSGPNPALFLLSSLGGLAVWTRRGDQTGKRRPVISWSRDKQHLGGERWELLQARVSGQVSRVLMRRHLPLPDRWLSLFRCAASRLMAGSPCPRWERAVFLLLLMLLICWPQGDPVEAELKLTCHFL